MVSKLLWRLAKFFKVVDPDKTISLTNLAVWVVLVRLVVSKDVISPVDIGALIGTLLPYQAKKYIGKMKNNDPQPEVNNVVPQ